MEKKKNGKIFKKDLKDASGIVREGFTD